MGRALWLKEFGPMTASAVQSTARHSTLVDSEREAMRKHLAGHTSSSCLLPALLLSLSSISSALKIDSYRSPAKIAVRASYLFFFFFFFDEINRASPSLSLTLHRVIDVIVTHALGLPFRFVFVFVLVRLDGLIDDRRYHDSIHSPPPSSVYPSQSNSRFRVHARFCACPGRGRRLLQPWPWPCPSSASPT